VCRLKGEGEGYLLLLQDLLHVHRQAHHALPPQGPRRPGLRLLHGRSYSGKGYDEFWRRSIEDENAVYIRGAVSRLYQKGDKIVVMGSDIALGIQVEIEADLVVLATAVQREPAPSSSPRSWDLLRQVQLLLRGPRETQAGGVRHRRVYLAGACQGPKDIPDTVSQASAAAAKVMTLFAKDELEREPIVAKVDDKRCVACFYCKKVCPYGAVEEKEIRDRQGT